MLRKDIINLYASLNTLGSVTGGKFAYGVAKNVHILKGEVESMEKSFKPSEGFIEYENERVKLAKEHSKKTKEGKEMTEGEGQTKQYVMENQDKFDKELEKLQKKHDKVIKDREKQIDDYIKFLDEEGPKIELWKIKLVDVPDTLNVRQVNGIFEIIEEK